MNNSVFDALMSDADQVLLNAFGIALQIVLSPGDTPQTIQVDIETNLTVQTLGDRDRIGSTQRKGVLTLATFHEKDLPADPSKARLKYKGKSHVLVEPRIDGDMVEFILLPSVATNESGNKDTQFLT
jgi:hypothetical protein